MLRSIYFFAFLFATFFILPISGFAAVKVTMGPTPIIAGDGVSKGDITIQNDKLAITIAAETAAPWGVARGGIIDGSEVRNGKPGVDRITLVDFIPNNWSAWPTTYQKVTIEKNTASEVVVKTVRDWEKTKLTTVYTVRDGDDKVHMLTTMINEGDKSIDNILSGYVLWSNGGYLFSPPGLDGKKKGSADKILTTFAAAYDENWTVGLHAPYVNTVNYYGRDLYYQQNLAPGQQQTFEGWVQILPNGDISKVLSAESAQKKKAIGIFAGTVKTEKSIKVDAPVIVVEKNGVPYTWAIGENGSFSFELPEGKYTAYATARSYAASSKIKIEIDSSKKVVRNFSDLKAPGKIQFKVRDNDEQPLDARITIEKGEMPLVEFLGKKTFFTELNSIGQIEIPIAPGKYVFNVDAGANFVSEKVTANAEVASGGKETVSVIVDKKFRPRQSGWYSSDLHHHSNLMDGVTPPEYLVRSQLAVGLDFIFISDHDLVSNHKETQALSDGRELFFIPGNEISPSWGHFNAYPLRLGAPLQIDVSVAGVDEVFAEAKRLGAEIIAVNHPFNAYGYFNNFEQGKATGGWNPEFDLIELNGQWDKTATRVWDFWNKGNRYYFTAGSDTHDVWNSISGNIRMFVKIKDKPTIGKFIQGLKRGQSYASFGPLVDPEIPFGSDLIVEKGKLLKLNFNLSAVNGLKEVSLISQGKAVEVKKFEKGVKETAVSFSVSPAKSTWYSLVVMDTKDLKAWTNPVWVSVSEYTKLAE